MKTVKLLLGSSEGRFNKVLETLVRDAFRDAAVLHTTRAEKVSDFINLGSGASFDLAIIIPDHLRTELNPNGSPGPAAEAARAISALKAQRPIPILAFSIGAQYEPALTEAGAEYVLDIPFRCDEVKTVVRRLVPLYAGNQPTGKWSWAQLLKRGLGLAKG